jgi:hypothetical protein
LDVRWLALSVVVHALALWLLRGQTPLAPVARTNVSAGQVVEVVPDPIVVSLEDEPQGGGGHGGGHAARTGHAVHADPWGQLAIGVDNGQGIGSGEGAGGGHGRGIGFGEGGGIARSTAVPLPPAPPPPSRARPARLIHPSRDREVEDDDDLFVARVTVDTAGEVVAVHMVTSHPGVRGDQAASAIWTFRYAPALDDAGDPVRSTFEQPFQIR